MWKTDVQVAQERGRQWPGKLHGVRPPRDRPQQETPTPQLWSWRGRGRGVARSSEPGQPGSGGPRRNRSPEPLEGKPGRPHPAWVWVGPEGVAPPGAREAEAQGGHGLWTDSRAAKPRFLSPGPGLKLQGPDNRITPSPGELRAGRWQAQGQACTEAMSPTHQSCSFTRRPSSRMVVVL